MACTVSVDQFHGKIKTKFSPRSPGGRPPRGPAPCTTVVRTFGLTRNSYCSYSNPVAWPPRGFVPFHPSQRSTRTGAVTTVVSAPPARARGTCACASARLRRAAAPPPAPAPWPLPPGGADARWPSSAAPGPPAACPTPWPR
jgi:hypothetical protein